MALGRAAHDVVYNKMGKSKYASSKGGAKKVVKKTVGKAKKKR